MIQNNLFYESVIILFITSFIVRILPSFIKINLVEKYSDVFSNYIPLAVFLNFLVYIIYTGFLNDEHTIIPFLIMFILFFFKKWIPNLVIIFLVSFVYYNVSR